MFRSMKTKKAIKKLSKAESLLEAVIDKCDSDQVSLQETLDEARAALVRAKLAVTQNGGTRTPKKPPVKANSPKQVHAGAKRSRRESQQKTA